MAQFSKPNSTPLSSFSPSGLVEQEEELQKSLEHAPQFWKNKKMLSKQLSMRETPRDVAWERKRSQMLKHETRKSGIPKANTTSECDDRLTDEDLSELRGSIDLGFGFNEEGIKMSAGKRLCNTLPALDLYFAVNRQFATSPITSPCSQRSSQQLVPVWSSTSNSCTESPNSDDSWKICCPGDNPQMVKTRLRHWAQAVACSVRQAH